MGGIGMSQSFFFLLAKAFPIAVKTLTSIQRWRWKMTKDLGGGGWVWVDEREDITSQGEGARAQQR